MGDTMSIERVFIVGSGLMGSGIAQACAQSGLQVVLNDVQPEALLKAKKNLAWSVGKLVEKGTVLGSVDAILSRITTSTELDAAGQSDLIIEAVFENVELKRDVFRKIDRVAQPGAIIASNTSAISISDLAGVTERAEYVLGLHFFSPVPMMPAAEVIRGMLTSEDTFVRGVDFVRRLGKEPILVHRDLPAFVMKYSRRFFTPTDSVTKFRFSSKCLFPNATRRNRRNRPMMSSSNQSPSTMGITLSSSGRNEGVGTLAR